MAFNLTGTNMTMRAQVAGASQRGGQVRKTQKQETTRTSTPTKEKKQKGLRDTYKFSGTQSPKTHRRKTSQVMRRFVAGTGQAKDSKKAQTTDSKKAQETKHAREKQQLPQPQEQTPLDNASRIGLMYQQAMRKNRGKNQAKGRVEQNPAQTQQKHLKKFLGNLKNYVNLEYKQYTKQDISLYSRRNLREILSALGHETKAFDNKIAKDRRSRQNNGVAGAKKYNKHYAARATKQLKLFNEDPMQDPNYDPFEMIA